MNERETRKYHRLRSEDPYLPARNALAAARSTTYGEWHGDTLVFYQGGFEVRVTVDEESRAPRDGDYGHYVDARSWDQGLEVSTFEDAPLGLPARHFRHPSASRDVYDHFVPDDVEDQFGYYRRMGASRSVARDLTVAWTERWVAELMQSLAYYDVKVSACMNGVELGTTYTAFDVMDDELESMAEEVGRDAAYEAIAEAEERLAELVQAAEDRGELFDHENDEHYERSVA